MSKLNQVLVAVAIGAAAVPTAFANSGSTPVNNERGVRTHAMPASGISRAQVLADLQAFRNNPVAADGSRYVGGEAGWVVAGHGSAWQGGRLVHADAIDHNAPRASASLTPQSRALYRDLYSGG